MEKIIHFVEEMYVAPLIVRETEILAFGDQLFAQTVTAPGGSGAHRRRGALAGRGGGAGRLGAIASGRRTAPSPRPRKKAAGSGGTRAKTRWRLPTKAS